MDQNAEVDVSDIEIDDLGNDAEEANVLQMSVEVGTQSVISNAIPLFVHVMPAVDASKARISWSVPRGLSADGVTEGWFTMTDGEALTFRIDVTPEAAGSYTVVPEVTAWRFDTNYVGAEEINFEVDASLHVSPAQSEYQRNKMVLVVAEIVGIMLGVVGILVLVKFLMKRFKLWLAED